MQGSILNKIYQIESQISQRGSRATYLAKNRGTNEPVVIKILKFGFDAEWSDFKLFEREAQTLKNINHPNIPNYLDYFELNLPDCKGFALVQEYIAAPSLEAAIKAGRKFSESEIKEVATALLEILTYLHQQYPAIIHRDIKPSNILLTDRSGNSIGQVYLIDFGAVKSAASIEGGTITVVGTYGYMPPEQFGGYTTPASDLYSLGATLIYIATGKHPTELPSKDGTISFAESVQLSYFLIRWLQKIIETTRSRRFQSATEALSALNEPIAKQTTTHIIKQPQFSRVVIAKTAAEIDVLIPNATLVVHKIQYCLIILMLCFLIALFTFGGTFLFPWIPSVLGISISIPFWIMLWFALTYDFFEFFADTRLKIDADEISLTYELGKIKREKTLSSPRAKINAIEFGKHSQKLFEYKGETIYLDSEIMIWANAIPYRIKSSLKDRSRISLTFDPVSIELTWLAKELSQWLDLPLTYERAVLPKTDNSDI